MANIFNPTEITIEELINNEYFLKIPDFQRSYTWDEEKTIDLINSISKSSSTNKLFLGTIYYEENYKSKYIIDGQQRLITIYLTINAIRLLKGNKLKLDHLLTNKQGQTYLDVYESTPLHQNLFKIEKIGDISNIEDKIDKKNLTQRQILENQKKIYRFLIEFPHIIKEFLDGIKNAIIIMIHVPKTQNINKIFKNINSKGVPLTNAEIVKNAFFEYVKSEKGVSFEKQLKYTYWKKIEENMLYDNRTDKLSLSKAKNKLESSLATCIYWFIVFNNQKIILKKGFSTSEYYEQLLNEPDAL